MDEHTSFLTRAYGGVPMWGWIIGGVAVLYFGSKMGWIGKASATASASATSSTQSASSASSDPPAVMYLQNDAGTNPGTPNQFTVNLNRHSGNYLTDQSAWDAAHGVIPPVGA